MKHQQRLEKALQNANSRPLTDEMLNAAKTRSWDAIAEKLVQPSVEQHQLMHFLNPLYNKKLAPAFIFATTLVLLIGIGFTLFKPAQNQPTVITKIDKTTHPETPPVDKTITDNQNDQYIIPSTKSVYTNSEVGFSVELPGQYSKKLGSLAKKGFELKDSLELSENNIAFADVSIFTAKNTDKQPVQEWLDDHNIKGARKIIEIGSYKGVSISHSSVSLSDTWKNSFIAYAADTTGNDFYTTANGQILQISTQAIADSKVKLPDLTASYQTFHRAGRTAFQYGFQPMRYQNKIYLFGGIDNTKKSEDAARKVYVYDTQIDEWSEKNDIPKSLLDERNELHFYSGTVIGDEAYLVRSINNNDSKMKLAIYNLKNDSWTERTTSLAPYPSTYVGTGITQLNNKLYLVGGYIYDKSKPVPLTSTYSTATIETTNTTYIYDINHDKWEIGPTLNTSRYTQAVTTFNGRIYAMLGESGNLSTPQKGLSDFLKRTTLTVEYLDPAKDNQWHKANNFPVPSAVTGGYGYSIISLNKSMYYIDSLDIITKDSQDSFSGQAGVRIFQYDQGKDSWTRIYPSFQIRDVRGVVPFDNSVFVFGTGPGSEITQLEEFVLSK